MAPKHFFFAFIPFFLFLSCSTPSAEPSIPHKSTSTRLSDPIFQSIHDAKNNRSTHTLVDYLNHPQPQYRAEAAMCLGAVQDSTSLINLSLSLRDTSPEVRLMAAFALGQLYKPTAAPPLIELVGRDTTTTIRTEALEATGKCGGDQAVKFLEDYVPRYLFDEAGQAWGIYRLALQNQATERHAEIEAQLLNSPFEESRLAAAYFFFRYRDKIPDEWIDKLAGLAAGDSIDEVRAAATKALGIHGTPAFEETLGSLAFRDPYPGVREAAISALESIGPRLARDTIWQAMFDGNPNVALTAARYFCDGLKAEETEKVHQQAIVHPFRNVQIALYSALLKFSPKPEWVHEVQIHLNCAENDQHLAGWVSPLSSVPEMYPYLDSLVIHAPPIVGTAALQALPLSDANCAEFASLIGKVFDRRDPGQLAYIGSLISDPSNGLGACIAEPQQLRAVMDVLHIPEASEAWIELNKAYALITGEKPLPMPDVQYQPIDWERLSAMDENSTLKIVTSKGVVRLALLPQDAPATVSYFLTLVETGFFNGKAFHRVVPNFVVQTGCPRGDGYGAPDRTIRSEFSPLHYGPGVVGMASAGKDTESSQWFITHRTTPHLDGRYTIFAAVIQGMDVVWQLEKGDVIDSIELEQDVEPTP